MNPDDLKYVGEGFQLNTPGEGGAREWVAEDSWTRGTHLSTGHWQQQQHHQQQLPRSHSLIKHAGGGVVRGRSLRRNRGTPRTGGMEAVAPPATPPNQFNDY